METLPYTRVAAHAQNWQQIGASYALIRLIRYVFLLPWTGQPRRGVRREYPLTAEGFEFASEEMNRWANQGFAEEISEPDGHSIRLVVSGFVVRGSKPRVIIDYTAQNEFLETRKFRMDTLGDLAPQLQADDVLIKAYFKDVYYHLRLRRCNRNKLLFRISGRFFRPLALNCGLSWLFTKFKRPVLQDLRRQGHRIISYLDNISGAPRSNSQMLQATPSDAETAGEEIRALL
jgi:hypothetical protein